MSSIAYNWNKFKKRVTIHADAQIIYNAWATQSGLESWFLRQATFTKPDGSLRAADEHTEANDIYLWRWHGHPDEVFENRKILQANGTNFLQFIFSGNCIVSVEIKNEEGENILELTQENIPDDDNPATSLYVGCGEGWTFYITNLKSVLEGRFDLRNKNINISRVINA